MGLGFRAALRFSLLVILLMAATAFVSGVAMKPAATPIDRDVDLHAIDLISEGRQTFRYDTFGDEAFWGGALRLHEALRTLTPRTALAIGLKIDADALPHRTLEAIRSGRVNLDDPAVTQELLRDHAVVGVTGFFTGSRLTSVGIQCAFCHSTVDNSVAPGVGRRLDGWANRDLDVGRIISLAPNLQPFAELLGVSVDDVRAVLLAWGPGKFDAELELDGKGFRPDGKTAASLIPPAFGLPGVNLHTWIGWGSVTHWNAFVANLEMHGSGPFFDPRLNNAAQFPIAARAGFANVRNSPDLITPKLAALHFYQLAIPAPRPPEGSFDAVAAAAGDELFEGKAKCATCHVPPLYTEPGWNLHTPDEIGIDAFQADRGPDHRYRTSPLKGLWTHTKGGFYHDGRFATLRELIDHYDAQFSLGLTDTEKHELEQYLLSLGDVPVPGLVAAHRRSDEQVVSNATVEAVGLDLIGPNPTRGSVALQLSLPNDAVVDAWVVDVSGRRIATLVTGAHFTAGVHALAWNGRTLEGAAAKPGVYFVRALTGGQAWTRRVTLLAE